MNRTLAAVICAGTVATGSALAAENDRPRTLRSPKLYYLDHFDESKPLREMAVLPPRGGERRKHPVKLLHPPRAFPRELRRSGGPAR